MYTVAEYGRMAADTVRMDAYQRAIAKTVRPGSVVLDLGAGSGIVSLLAARAGAKRVHAVDPNPAVWLIPELAAESGLADRIVVHHSSSLEMAVPEPIDVVISDMRGATPLLGDNLAALKDIRTRWLAPNGILVPSRDRLEVALVEGRGMAAHLEDACASFERLGFPAEAARRSIRNLPYGDSAAPLAASDLLSTTATWARIEYATVDTRPLEGTVTLDVVRGATAHGLSVFFETELVEGIRFHTAPGQAVVYNRYFLPLLTPVIVAPGDRVHVTVRADARGDRWAWDTSFERAGAVIANHRQATFLGTPASMDALLRSSEGHTPKLAPRGERLRDILTAMDGTRTVQSIAKTVSEAKGTPAGVDILDEVRSAAMRYGA